MGRKYAPPIFHISLNSGDENSETNNNDKCTAPYNKQVEEFNRSLKVPGGTLADAMRRQSWSSWLTSKPGWNTNKYHQHVNEADYRTYL